MKYAAKYLNFNYPLVPGSCPMNLPYQMLHPRNVLLRRTEGQQWHQRQFLSWQIFFAVPFPKRAQNVHPPRFIYLFVLTKFPYQVHSYGAGTVMYHERASPVLKPTYPKTTPHLGNVIVTNLYLPHTNVLSARAWKIPFDKCPWIYQMKPLENKQTNKKHLNEMRVSSC